jgi:hypothetical protein
MLITVATKNRQNVTKPMIATHVTAKQLIWKIDCICTAGYNPVAEKHTIRNFL